MSRFDILLIGLYTINNLCNCLKTTQITLSFIHSKEDQNTDVVVLWKYQFRRPFEVQKVVSKLICCHFNVLHNYRE